jgi:hypothetical protein
MPEWNFEEIEGDVRVTHWHPDGRRHPASVVTDQGGRRRADCDDCHAVVAVDRATEERLIADESADALAYDDSEQPA